MNRSMIIGVDEVGRGPLAGPVAVCAVLIKRRLPRGFFAGIHNSKALSENARAEWFERALAARRAGYIEFAVAFSGRNYIDRHGISKAVRASIARALSRLDVSPDSVTVLLDGSIYAPKAYRSQRTIVRGDELVPVISLASIIAKVRRDARMRRYAKTFAQYGFDEHKGYGTAAHYRALERYGLTPLHRRSFLSGFLQKTR